MVDLPELKIEDCRLNICGCRFAPSFFKLIRRRRTLNIQYSIENIQSLGDGENIAIQLICHKENKIHS